MNIYAKGKNIQTYSFGRLFIQGEKIAEEINIFIRRFYNGWDMSGYTFTITGKTEGNEPVSQQLTPWQEGDNIKLIWRVLSSFTAVSGELSLELKAVGSDPERIIKFNMPPVYVRKAE